MRPSSDRRGIQHCEQRLKRLPDRKSTRLNSSHANISYAVFCLKKKKKKLHTSQENISSVDFCINKRTTKSNDSVYLCDHNGDAHCSVNCMSGSSGIVQFMTDW